MISKGEQGEERERERERVSARWRSHSHSGHRETTKDPKCEDACQNSSNPQLPGSLPTATLFCSVCLCVAITLAPCVPQLSLSHCPRCSVEPCVFATPR